MVLLNNSLVNKLYQGGNSIAVNTSCKMIFESFTICIIFPYLQVESMVYVENAWIFQMCYQ